MAAGLGFKTFTSGEVLTAADTNGYLMQGILVFANASARTAAVTSPQEGQYSYLKDTNALEYYDGAAWVGAPVGDITAVTAGTGISGGGSSGDVTITNSMATTIDAKGDLIAGTADNAFARLAVGNNGETLVADSAATTGLRYSATPSASNPILNSAFQVWQRGTSFSIAASTGAGSTTFSADRWQTATNANQAITISRQVTGDTTNLPNIQYCLRYQRNSGQTGIGSLNFSQNFETVNTIPFAGKTITYSFYARAGANYSPTSSALIGIVYTGTGTDQNVFGGYTGNAYNYTTATLTTTWQRFSVTMAIPSNATEMAPGFQYNPTGTAGTNDYYEVTGVQIDIGSVALPFRTYAATIQGELAACQRYYVRIGGNATNQVLGGGTANGTTQADIQTPLPVSMRTNASSIEYSTLVLQQKGGAGLSAVTSVTLGLQSPSIGNATFNVASGTVDGAWHRLMTNSSTTGYLAYNAEL